MAVFEMHVSLLLKNWTVYKCLRYLNICCWYFRKTRSLSVDYITVFPFSQNNIIFFKILKNLPSFHSYKISRPDICVRKYLNHNRFLEKTHQAKKKNLAVDRSIFEESSIQKRRCTIFSTPTISFLKALQKNIFLETIFLSG